jgi:PqqD family protein of HPr-rel-A system
VRLHWQNWDDDWVVFDEASGMTHQMSAMTAFVLSSVEAAPQDFGALAAELADATGLVLPTARAALRSALEDLSKFGLVDTEVQ